MIHMMRVSAHCSIPAQLLPRDANQTTQVLFQDSTQPVIVCYNTLQTKWVQVAFSNDLYVFIVGCHHDHTQKIVVETPVGIIEAKHLPHKVSAHHHRQR